MRPIPLLPHHPDTLVGLDALRRQRPDRP